MNSPILPKTSWLYKKTIEVINSKKLLEKNNIPPPDTKISETYTKIDGSIQASIMDQYLLSNNYSGFYYVDN